MDTYGMREREREHERQGTEARNFEETSMHKNHIRTILIGLILDRCNGRKVDTSRRSIGSTVTSKWFHLECLHGRKKGKVRLWSGSSF